jgi:hypothetical protein
MFTEVSFFFPFFLPFLESQVPSTWLAEGRGSNSSLTCLDFTTFFFGFEAFFVGVLQDPSAEAEVRDFFELGRAFTVTRESAVSFEAMAGVGLEMVGLAGDSSAELMVGVTKV